MRTMAVWVVTNSGVLGGDKFRRFCAPHHLRRSLSCHDDLKTPFMLAYTHWDAGAHTGIPATKGSIMPSRVQSDHHLMYHVLAERAIEAVGPEMQRMLSACSLHQ